eukprot:13004-Rhodomonas_salina.2
MEGGPARRRSRAGPLQGAAAAASAGRENVQCCPRKVQRAGEITAQRLCCMSFLRLFALRLCPCDRGATHRQSSRAGPRVECWLLAALVDCACCCACWQYEEAHLWADRDAVESESASARPHSYRGHRAAATRAWPAATRA